jgi:hypothetical protein
MKLANKAYSVALILLTFVFMVSAQTTTTTTTNSDARPEKDAVIRLRLSAQEVLREVRPVCLPFMTDKP